MGVQKRKQLALCKGLGRLPEAYLSLKESAEMYQEGKRR